IAAKNPPNGIVISLGMGTHALSKNISINIAKYPN
ncbi:unnamed protein product, partial [marine sediment metagenome]